MNNTFVTVAGDLRHAVDQAQPLLAKLSDSDAGAHSRPGKWSHKEILGHLLDSACNNHQRFVRAALERNLVFPGYSQDELVTLQRFNEMQWSFLVEFWTRYNRFLAHVVSVLPAESASVICEIGKNPQATLEWIAKDYVAHLKHHLNQIVGPVFPTNYGK